MKKIIVGVVCIMCMVCGFILYSPQVLADMPEGTIGDDYYKLIEGPLYYSKDSYNGPWYVSSDKRYNGGRVITSVTDDWVSSVNTRYYEVEIRPVNGNKEILSAFTPVVKTYTNLVEKTYGSKSSRVYYNMRDTLYLEDLPYPGTKYYYVIRECYAKEKEKIEHYVNSYGEAAWAYGYGYGYSYSRIVKTGTFTTTGIQPEWLANYSSGSSGGSSLDYSTVFAEIRDKLINIATNLGSVDREAPELTLLWEGNKTSTSVGVPIKLVAVVQDNVSPIGKIKLEWSKDNGANYTEFPKDGSGNYEQSSNITFSDGNKFVNVLVKATDEAGKQAMGYKTIYVQ